MVSLAVRKRVVVLSETVESTAELSAVMAVKARLSPDGMMLSVIAVVSAKLLFTNESVSLLIPTALLASIPNDCIAAIMTRVNGTHILAKKRFIQDGKGTNNQCNTQIGRPKSLPIHIFQLDLKGCHSIMTPSAAISSSALRCPV